MRIGLDKLRSYYRTAAGDRIRRRLATAVAPLILKGAERRLLIVGFASPILDGLSPSRFERMAMLVGGDEPPRPWPRGSRTSISVHGLPCDMPFPGALFDQALVVHSWEYEDAEALLEELQRTVAPGGQLILIVPNRSGLWSPFDRSPFASGRPWSRADLTTALGRQGFVPREWKTVMSAPRVAGLGWLERPLNMLLPGMGGIHVVLAEKRSGPVGARAATRVRAQRPVTAPARAAVARATP